MTTGASGGYPWTFYGLTEESREFLEEHNLLAAEETLQQIYNTISDKPEKWSSTRTHPVPIASNGTFYFRIVCYSYASAGEERILD